MLYMIIMQNMRPQRILLILHIFDAKSKYVRRQWLLTLFFLAERA